MTYKELPGPVEGYKIVNDDMTCHGFKFEVGVKHKLGDDGPLELCKHGFHFCKYPSGVWAYYQQGRVFRVRAWGVLELPDEPGADYKLVAREIELVKEVKGGGDKNTGDGNTGNWNTGYRNTGDGNTGCRNTGDRNTGNWNTGYWNTGDWNTGYRNTGCRNTGCRNTGDWNTGDWNTGDGNASDYSSGYFCTSAPVYLFDRPVKIKREDLDFSLINQLSEKLMSDDPFDPAPYLKIPNATKARILKIHQAHIERRKAMREGRA